uniref:Uncharacterized protein n=1 Tax=Cyclophora tenuis TaxID=216820 RepID=A0A7S1D0Y9_CYCTE
MMDLKNASKSGNVTMAFETIQRMSKKYFGYRHLPTSLLVMTRLLVSPDLENRSAIYYAAHSGHVAMVKIYLSVLILWLTKRRRRRHEDMNDDVDSSSESRATMKGWFDRVGYIKFFGKRQLEVCVLNALNEDVRRVFEKENFSMQQLKSIVLGTPFSEWARDMNNKNRKNKARRPTINVEKTNDEHYYSNNDQQDLYSREEEDDDSWDYHEDSLDDYDDDGQEEQDVSDEVWEVDSELYHLLDEINLDSIQEDMALISMEDESHFPPLGASALDQKQPRLRDSVPPQQRDDDDDDNSMVFVSAAGSTERNDDANDDDNMSKLSSCWDEVLSEASTSFSFVTSTPPLEANKGKEADDVSASCNGDDGFSDTFSFLGDTGTNESLCAAAAEDCHDDDDSWAAVPVAISRVPAPPVSYRSALLAPVTNKGEGVRQKEGMCVGRSSKPGLLANNSNNSNTRLRKCDKGKGAEQSEQNEGFDSHFVYEGVKEGRGGRTKTYRRKPR